ncbi:hypothetical protein [Pseudomonas extremaustralis]|uniref:hypothetical protein n=1 Tax=Pseudomonas extremaustralis TaxID=359110 RepID=UPI00285A27EE|nr:hypothetical protein [Pseudomonas extremaustralis]MDR6581636.1 hypothetical protein [Pseudomonas extremaustralis]
MSNLDYFRRGLERAIARQSVQREQPNVKQVQKVEGDTSTTSITGANIIAPNAVTPTKLSLEQYRATIISKMIQLINRQKEIRND